MDTKNYKDTTTYLENNNFFYEHTITNDQFKVSVFDVAAFILAILKEVSTLKLQKLVYYSQVWNLVWEEKPLFQEKIEAWINGPVVRELFYYFQGKYKAKKLLKGNPNILSNIEKDNIKNVIEFYNKYSAQELVNLTHQEEPWIIARKGLQPLERGNKEIKLDTIINYYSSL